MDNKNLPTSIKLRPDIKEKLEKYNTEHNEQPLILSIFVNNQLEKWLKSKGY